MSRLREGKGPVLLRSALPDDAESVADVYLRSRRELVAFAPLAHTDDEVRAWIRESLIPEAGVTVAVKAGSVVGMQAVSRDEEFSWIDQLYVDPDWVGRGIGSSLLEHALAELVPPIRLYTFQENRRSRGFYEGRGFRAVAFGDGTGNEEGCPDVLYEWRP
ncbi:MAG: GNAT family N-acetyltransferase [Actinobacteria bacterium]|nr:GNAT family N-acetyltransferase [Actinomycetota bacterium]